MMKILSGAELGDYIKERQAKQVRALKQAWHTHPRLAIVITNDNPVIETYVRLKTRYADDIGVVVDTYRLNEDEASAKIDELNEDETVHGVIVQLPLRDPARTDELVSRIAPEKDVDALGSGSMWDAATPVAINWLLAGYNVILKEKHIVIVGEGRLVGAPLARMWRSSNYDVEVVSEPTEGLADIIKTADIVVSATGTPGLITSDMLMPETVVVDAGTATENGAIVGDVATSVRDRHDLTITPIKGGVGPLTIAALLDNVLRAARDTVTETA